MSTTASMNNIVNIGEAASIESQTSSAVVDAGATSQEQPHVHGPNCGHDHSHEETPQKEVQGKYLNPSMIDPGLDIMASWRTVGQPLWRANVSQLSTLIAIAAAGVPEGGVKVCFVNNEAYKFLLADRQFRMNFQPASPEQQKRGIVGLFRTQVVIICDALWEQGDQVTMPKAIYFGDEVLVPVTEVVVETSLKEDLKELHTTAVATAVENGATPEEVSSAQLS